MQKAKQRSEIAQQDKWRIEDIYATDEAWEADYNECIRRAKEKCAYQGRLAESALILYQALKESDEADLLVEHVYVYAFMKYYEDTANAVYQEMSGRAQAAVTKLSEKYAFLTPEEIVGTMTACGVDGYTSYGMNGLDDGGVLNRMEDDFLDSLRRGNTWCAEVIPKRGKSKFKEIAILFPSEMSDYEPFDVENNEIRRLDMLGWYEICCDLGYQTDVISYHDILENKLNDYKMLIVPSNDCYFAEEHTDMEKMIREWVTNGGVVLHGPDCGLSKNCFGIQGIPCEKTPYIYQKPVIPQGCEFQRYETGRCISAYADDAGKCIVMQEIEKGKVISCGVQLGASYVAKNIPHVPYEQRNKEMYPIIQARSTLLEDLLGVCGKPVSGICERGIEAGVFETGMVLVNHRSTPYEIGNLKGNRKFTNPVNDTVLLPHSAVWIERE